TFGPGALALAECAEQAAQERQQRHALELHAPHRLPRLLLALRQALVAVRVAQRLCRDRGHHLHESHVLVGERGAIAEGTQENRPDRHTAPRDRHHRDGLHAAADELALPVLETRIGGRAGDEHRLAALHRAFQLGVALEVHHVVANGGILVGGDQPHGPAAALGEKDRAAVQPERLAQLTRDALEDVDEMERGGNFLENLDDREQMLALALELGNARLECGGERHGIVSSPADAASSCRARARAIASEPMRSLLVAACVAVPALAAPERPSPGPPPLCAWSPVPELPGLGRHVDTAMAAARIPARGHPSVPLDQRLSDDKLIRVLPFAERGVRNLRPRADSMRLETDADEIARMRKAVDISVLGHVAAMQAARPGVWEYEIEAVLEAAFRRNGADRVGYPSIVGSGPNSTTLHYDVSRRQTRDGDLVVVDAGAEWGQYTADVTRTFPVNGKFTPRQKAIYDLVLATQQAAFDSTRPGTTIAQ